jgi:hypothetical protein
MTLDEKAPSISPLFPNYLYLPLILELSEPGEETFEVIALPAIED